MPNVVGSNYILRAVWDEMRWWSTKPAYDDLFPHVAAFIRDRRVHFVAKHIQNFCWTLNRFKVSLKKAQPLPQSKVFITRATADCRTSRIFIDITNTMKNGFCTGIQRVCMRLATEGAQSAKMTPVMLGEDGRLRALTSASTEQNVALRPGDIYVILDTFWEPLDAYVSFAKNAREQGALVATLFYDVIPAIHPELCMISFGEIFSAALKEICPVTDIFVGISEATLDDLRSILPRLGQTEQADKEFFYFHLGADDDLSDAADVMLPGDLTSHPFFLSVGTVEPKKGYCLALDAFDRLWAEGHEVNYAIIGKYGWCAESTRERLLGHRLLGKHLFWFQTASDAFLAAAYKQSYCFIQASVAEGFGLPVIEAARHGLPIIASDIDVFKEIAGNNLVYFESENANALADQIEAAIKKRPVAKLWPVPTWQSAMEDLYQKLHDAARSIDLQNRASVDGERLFVNQ